MKNIFKKLFSRFDTGVYIVVFFAIVYIIIALLPKTQGVSLSNGDEPHYLLMSYSMLHDKDLDMYNNYKNNDYKTWYPEGKLEMHLFQFDNKYYIFHQVGISAFVLPGFLLGGRLGAVIMLCIITALALRNLHSILLFYVKRKIALFTTLVVGLSVPVGTYASLNYPEVALFFLFSCAFVIFLHPSFSFKLKELLLLFLSIAFVPVFHIKFVTLLGLFLLMFSVAYFKKAGLKKLFILNVIMIIPTVLYTVWYNNLLDGHLMAGMSSISSTSPLLLSNIPTGLLAYLVDRENGILLFSPLYVYTIYGIVSFIKEGKFSLLKRKKMGLSLLFAAGFIGFFTMYKDLIGGMNPAGRYLLPVVVPLAIFLATGIQKMLKDAVQRVIIMVLAGYSLIIFIILSVNPVMALPFGTQSNLVNFIFRGQAPPIIHIILPNLSKYNGHIVTNEDIIKGVLIMLGLLLVLLINTKRVRYVTNFLKDPQ